MYDPFYAIGNLGPLEDGTAELVCNTSSDSGVNTDSGTIVYSNGWHDQPYVFFYDLKNEPLICVE